MHRKRRRAALAGAAVAAVTAGLALGPPAGAAPGDAGAPRADGAGNEITLITGDRVLLGADGQVLGVRRADGRAHVPFSVTAGEDGTFVVPSDAEPLIERGVVDRRLFDVAELSRPEYRRLAGDGVPVIVGHGGGRQARPFTAEAPEVRAELDSIDARAMTLDAEQAADAWAALTGPGPRARAQGVTSLALDAVRHASLDTSVPRIGAPEAWAAGLDGSGVTIAVLDTGIDAAHPAFADGQVVAEANFSFAPDPADRDGHGTHVASIAAGTGGPEGVHRGVAPGADLLNGKVLDDYGSGFDSGIIAGMEWAVEQDADIVNMSLGGPDTPGVDPLEQAVNTLTAESGALFVIAAGNHGPEPGTLGSPGSADAALTVGSVDDEDRLAGSSSAGPRLGDSAVKPDLTAPGVDIGAAAAEGSRVAERGTPVAEGYAAISGTSMASPHVAGAAALVAQARPESTGEQIKAALVASAIPADGFSAFRQGAGRVDVARAVEQTVLAGGPLDFGAAEWPHDDGSTLTEELTWTNLGEQDVTLDLSLTGQAPDGSPAPEGMFSLDADTVTVPAGGTASVTATAAPGAAGADAVGGYGMHVVATGDGRSVTTAGGVELLEESWTVTAEATARDGGAPDRWSLDVLDLATGQAETVTGDAGDDTRAVRLPADGDYLLVSTIEDQDADGRVTDASAQVHHLPGLDQDTAVAFDAADARPVAPTVPDAQAVPFMLRVDAVTANGARVGWDYDPELTTLRTAFSGPDAGEALGAHLGAAWTAGEDAQYHVSARQAGAFFTGHERAYAAEDFAEVTIDQGATAEGTSGQLVVGNEHMSSFGPQRDLPATTTLHVTEGAWDHTLYFSGPGEGGGLGFPAHPYEAGESYAHTVNTGVFGPGLPDESAAYRRGDALDLFVPLADGGGHTGYLDGEAGSTTLTRDGEVVFELDDRLRGWTYIDVPPGQARYELTTEVRRQDARVSTEIDVTFGFTSGTVPEGELAALPTSVVRFAPPLAPDSTAEAGAELDVPVTVVGAAAGGDFPPPVVEVSYDSGDTWQEAAVADGHVPVQNPAAGGTVSFRASLTGPEGSTTEQTVIDAYRAT
ncbi:S8 family serine peptidase [Streptomyces marincola]|uniref:S8 family serine peptidase n=1 Tax=Streptomyces marincola TaxID=2878388 RepID=UPI001CF43AD7|nr:S8 family serine peptidase [Streptomyces marincola]UCM90033.1 S8 family serine peptidase [Streptomyces marincola]